MKTGSRARFAAARCTAATVLGAAATQALAQRAPAAGEAVSGALLQAWLDGKFSSAGVNEPTLA